MWGTVEECHAFERESKFLGVLHHPRLPKFMAAFQVGEGVHTRLYLAQELIEGESLEDRLAAHYFDEAEVIAIAKQVLEVLVYLQSCSPLVIHRDIKPGNLIRRHDGEVVLVDFGAARDQSSTMGTTQVGTFGYMPVEQLAGVVDKTTDTYALGMTLIRLLTRREPWKLLDDPWSHLNTSAGLRRFLQRLTAKTSKDRYPTASAALDALAGLKRVGRRQRRLLVVAAAVSIGGGVGGYAALRVGPHEKRPAATRDSQVPHPVTPLTPEACHRAPLRKKALAFQVAGHLHSSRGGRQALWMQQLGILSTYRTLIEKLSPGVPYKLPSLGSFLALPVGGLDDHLNGRRIAAQPIVPMLTADIKGSVFVIDGDYESASVTDSVVVATGNVRLHGGIRRSVVLAGGGIDYAEVIDNSLVIAGTAIGHNTHGLVHDSTLTAPLIKAELGTRSVLFGAVWVDVDSPDLDQSLAWNPIFEKLVHAWDPERLP